MIATPGTKRRRRRKGSAMHADADAAGGSATPLGGGRWGILCTEISFVKKGWKFLKAKLFLIF